MPVNQTTETPHTRQFATSNRGASSAPPQSASPPWGSTATGCATASHRQLSPWPGQRSLRHRSPRAEHRSAPACATGTGPAHQRSAPSLGHRASSELRSTLRPSVHPTLSRLPPGTGAALRGRAPAQRSRSAPQAQRSTPPSERRKIKHRLDIALPGPKGPSFSKFSKYSFNSHPLSPWFRSNDPNSLNHPPHPVGECNTRYISVTWWDSSPPPCRGWLGEKRESSVGVGLSWGFLK